MIKRTLAALGNQGLGLRVILVDDQSTDETLSVARFTLSTGLEVCQGSPLPPGWTGKPWALEQGWRKTRTKLVLLLDADRPEPFSPKPPSVSALIELLRNG